MIQIRELEKEYGKHQRARDKYTVLFQVQKKPDSSVWRQPYNQMVTLCSEHTDPEFSIEAWKKQQAIDVEHNPLHNRERYTVKTDYGEVKIEFVKPMRNTDFCKHCTWLRLTADGQFKTCSLRENDYFDIKDMLGDESEIDSMYREAVKARVPYWR